jgi:hypothetical protein
MNIKTYKFKITGIGAMLTNNPAGMNAGKNASGRSKIPAPEEEAELKAYRDAAGQLCIPSIWFRAATWAAASGKKAGKRTLRAIIQSSVFLAVDDSLTPILVASTGKPMTEYQIDIRTVVVNKARITRARPKYVDWGCFIEFKIDLDQITVEVVLNNLQEAGVTTGVGDFRIAKGGWFGRFTAELVG